MGDGCGDKSPGRPPLGRIGIDSPGKGCGMSWEGLERVDVVRAPGPGAAQFTTGKEWDFCPGAPPILTILGGPSPADCRPCLSPGMLGSSLRI